MEEIWKDIPGYEGLYQVSSCGQVRSIKSGRIRVLSPCLRKGYFAVDLSKNGKTRMRSVHRLVATAFVPNPNNFPEVNHKDETATNNNADNLEWCTSAYNNAYGTRPERIGSMKAKPVEQLRNGVIVGRWESARDASRAGFSSGCISECCNGRRTSHGGYEWRFAT